MTRGEIVHLQNEMNAFVQRNKSLGYAPLRVDGEMGRLTKQRIRDIKFDLGYARKNLKVAVGAPFFHRMRHPNWVRPEWRATKQAVKNGKKRRARRRIRVRQNQVRGFLKPGVGSFDGRPVAKAAIPVLQWCRAHGWHGVLVSGYRTPAYSESLCYRMCGRPQCPGRCAGRATNHAYALPTRFGIDVSDYVTFRTVVSRCPVRPHIHNALPNDRVHFSPSGQ